MKYSQRRGVVALLAALALVVSACGSGEDDRLAALEEELAQLRDGAAETEDDGASDTDPTEPDDTAVQEPDDPPADGQEPDDALPEDDAPAGTFEPITVDVGETQTTDDGDIEANVERITIHEYHVEVELTAVNSNPEDDRGLWRSGVERRQPLLFDEQDRRFVYQHPAGYNDRDFVSVAPGERVEAVLVFGRRLHPDATQLTLRFQDGALEGLEWAVDLPERS